MFLDDVILNRNLKKLRQNIDRMSKEKINLLYNLKKKEMVQILYKYYSKNGRINSQKRLSEIVKKFQI